MLGLWEEVGGPGENPAQTRAERANSTIKGLGRTQNLLAVRATVVITTPPSLNKRTCKYILFSHILLYTYYFVVLRG